MRKIVLLLVIGMLTLGLSSAMAQNKSSSDAVREEETVDAGNKVCPVSGEKIDEETKAAYEYQGKIYNFCCAVCIDEFKKDPEKYIKRVEEELSSAKQKAEEKATDAIANATQQPQGHAGHHH